MRTLLLLTFFLLLPHQTQASTLSLSGYQDQTGAISTLLTGDVVDPYFATKSLVLAHRLGMDISEAGMKWVDWVILHQKNDAIFKRYCKRPTVWKPCLDNDADDILYVMWIELLYSLAPDANLPSNWQHSLTMAKKHVASMYDAKAKIYRIFNDSPVALFMDNVEIYASLKETAKHQKRLGLDQEAHFTELRSEHLLSGIRKKFYDAKNARYRISTQAVSGESFYPFKVAQLYPNIYQLPKEHISISFEAWYAEHGKKWLSHKHDAYPWGLVTLAAEHSTQPGVAYCWLERAIEYRHSKRWNVLEEVLFQHLHSDPTAALDPTKCTENSP